MLFNYKKYFSLFALPKTLGFSLVELLVALGAFAILASGVIYVVTNSYTNFYGRGDKQVLAEFAQEALEAVRSIRENSWQYLEDNTGTDLGLTQVDGVWSFAGTSNTRGDFTRVVSISDTQRDSSGNLVLSGGIADPLTKKITVTVSASGIEDYVLTSYLTSWANRVWEQTDWSGGVGTQYWSYDNQAYSSTSVDGVTISGEITLAYTPNPSVLSWQDLNEDAWVVPGSTMTTYTTVVDEANEFWYLCGSTTATSYRFDLSSLLIDGTISLDSSTVPNTAVCYSSALNPVYSHYYVGGASGVVRTIDTGVLALSKTYSPSTSNGTIYAIAVTANGSRMYIGGSAGYLLSLSIALDGTLSCDNCTTVKGKDLGQSFGTGPIRSIWLDEANNKLYFSGDDDTRTLTKIDTSNTSSLSENYYYSSTYNMSDISYVGIGPSGYPRFAVVRDHQASGNEFEIIDDTPGSSSFNVVTGSDLSAQAGKTINAKNVEYTGNNEAFVLAVDTDGAPYIHLYAISGVDTSASPSLSIDYTNDTYYGYYSVLYNTIAYSAQYKGIFAGWTRYNSSARRGTYLEQSSFSSGTYDSTGNLVSSIIDLGSADQELHSLSITQDVPSSCAEGALEVTLEADNDVGFPSPSSQVFSSSTVSTFSTEINSALNNKRWLRYQVDMSNCDSGADTPTLYSVRLNYR